MIRLVNGRLDGGGSSVVPAPWSRSLTRIHRHLFLHIHDIHDITILLHLLLLLFLFLILFLLLKIQGKEDG